MANTLKKYGFDMEKKTKDSKVKVTYRGASMLDVVRYVHEEIVRECDYCGKAMTRSDYNDYGSLCERCYMKEYYGEEDY